MKFATKTIHAGVTPDKATGAIMTPIYQSSTFVHAAPHEHKGFVYSRLQNPTRQTLEQNLAVLENGQYGFCFASGMAASDAVFRLLKTGDEVLCSLNMYGGTHRILTQYYQAHGIKVHFVNWDEPEEVKKHIHAKTKLMWMESPTNPMMKIVDLAFYANLAKENNIWLGVDNTFATPYLQTPLDYGADFVMHSVTKYLGGHSDVLMGAVVVKDQDLAKQLHVIQTAAGAVPGPQDCFLTLRGIKTLHLRMQRHSENAGQVAAFLKGHPKVEQVFYPGLAGHPGHHLAKEQMNHFGGMLSFTLQNDSKAEAFKVMEQMKVFQIAESLGGVESMCGHPGTMSHMGLSAEEKAKIGLKESLIRLSVGIENVQDLIEDLQQALG